MPPKDFDTWNALKKHIHQKRFLAFVHAREVWWCSLGLNVGTEQDGKHTAFERPVLILRKFNRESVARRADHVATQANALPCALHP